MPAVNPQKVQDWLRIRRELLEMEAAFTDLAIRVATGLEAMREVCSAAYRQAFPGLREHT
jgi:hypothetical protein